MWRWDDEMRLLGFRRRGDRYWQCERRFGLSGHDHVSVFSWSEQALPGGAFVVDLTEFHVTFYRAGEALHFYYHETADHRWQPAGHTSVNEIARLRLRHERLRAEADAVARVLVARLGAAWVGR